MTSITAPQWVSVKQVTALQKRTIEIHGGSSGIRDYGSLESALVRPENFFSYGETDIFLLAATYAEGIARNHSFVDGNKRAAYLTAAFFLRSNGFHLNIKSVPEQITLFENLAKGAVSREELATFYRLYTAKIEE